MKKILILLLLFISFTLNAVTYYVDKSGTDAAGRNGSVGQEWLTVSYASTRVTTAGNTIHVNAGTYLENTRIALSAGVTLEGDGVTSIITNTAATNYINYGPNGSNGDAIINMIAASVVDGAQEIRNLKFDGASLTCSHALYIMNRHNVKIHDCTFINFNYSAVVWWASGTGDGTPPATRLTGSEFYNNTVTNCAGYNAQDGSFYGALYCGGHTGMLIHDNTMVENSHSTGSQGWPIKFWLWGGMMLDCKIYNNHLEKTDFSVWDFVIESTGEDGMEIYNNTMIGGIDLNKQNYSGVYTYSVYIHDNTIGPATEISALSTAGITLEWNNSHILIERNFIKNCSPAILFTPRTMAQTDITIRYNVFSKIPTSSYYTEGLTMNPLGAGTTIDGLYIYNNIFEGKDGYTDYGIRLVHAGGTALTSATNVNITNNIFLNFTGYNGSYLNLTGASVFNVINVKNNVLYNNGNSNAVLFTGSPTTYTNSGNVIGNPLFVGGSPYSYQLQSNSPAKDAGLNVGLTTDFRNYAVPYNSIPDIGAYEYGSTGDPVPVTSITVSGAGNATTISTDGGTLQMSASILPVNATEQSVTWSITNGTGTATISSGGLVTADHNGTVTVRATANDGSSVYDDQQLTLSNQDLPKYNKIGKYGTKWGLVGTKYGILIGN